MPAITTGLTSAAKAMLNALAIALALPAAGLCRLEIACRPGAEGLYTFWAQAYALLPGTAGMFLRRGFYRLTLKQCASDCFIGFGAVLAHRENRIGSRVYIGPFALIGSADLGDRSMVGSRASLLSGCRQHEPLAIGGWSACNQSRLQCIRIGRDVWIGEAAVVMADVGEGAQIAAGAVVSSRVPPDLLVAGNPARYVRRLRPDGEAVFPRLHGHEEGATSPAAITHGRQ